MDTPIRINETIVGKCALDNPDLPIEFIKDLLTSKYQDRSLAEPFSFEKNNHPRRGLFGREKQV